MQDVIEVGKRKKSLKKSKCVFISGVMQNVL